MSGKHIGILGVLNMTQQRSSDGIAAQLSPNAIPPDARSGFLISQERFLEEMVLPALPRAFPGSAPSDFAMSEDRSEVVNTKSIDLKPVSHLGVDYTPKLTSLSITVVGEEIQIASKTHTDIALGTYAETTATSYQRLKAATKPDGSQTLVYEQTRPPIKDHAVKTTAKGEALQIILDIVGVIVAAILVVLTGGAVLIVGLIIVSLLVGLANAIPRLIADAVGNKVSNESPSMALLVSNSTAPVRWPGAAQFKLTWAGFNESLQLGGDPGFV